MPLVDPSSFQEGPSIDDTPVVPGDYKVKIENIDLKNGVAAPYYFVRVRIMDGVYSNRVLVDNVSTSEKARWKWSDFVHSFNYTKPFDPVGGFDGMKAAAIAHKQWMFVRVGHEKNPRPGDEDRVRILRWMWKKEVAPLAPVTNEPVSDDDIPF